LEAGVDPGFVGPVSHKIWGGGLPSLRKRMQNYEYKIRYETEYLFRMRKEFITNYKFRKLKKNHNIFIN
jgi:hypothetical protein